MFYNYLNNVYKFLKTYNPQNNNSHIINANNMFITKLKTFNTKITNGGGTPLDDLSHSLSISSGLVSQLNQKQTELIEHYKTINHILDNFIKYIDHMHNKTSDKTLIDVKIQLETIKKLIKQYE